MAEPLFDVRLGNRPYTASGALSQGMLVVPHSTADQVVAAPATGPVNLLCLTNGTSGSRVDCMPIPRGAEIRVFASNTITAGQEVEFDSANAGKVKAFASGTKVGRAQEAAAAGGLVKIVVY